MNTLDKVIGWISPIAGIKRARARLAMDAARRYEGAASGRRVDSWQAQGLSANGEIALALPKLRDRHRDLVRNNPWASRAVQAIVSNTVSYGITAKVNGKPKLISTYKAWAESKACDASGQHNIYGLQGLIMRTVVESGECLVRRRWRRPSDGLPVPMQLQIMEPDYLDHTRTEILQGGGWIVQGKQYSPFGKLEGYWLYKSHPGDPITTSADVGFVPVSEIAHIYRQDRGSDQVRGVPWGTSVMITLRDLDDYEDAYLFRQKLANCQVGVVYDNSAGVDSTAAVPALSETMEPGRYDFLPAGKDIKFNTPPNAGDYGPFVNAALLRVAAGYGITFQALTGDLSSVNFSSGRMGWLEFGRNIDAWRWHMLIPQGLDVIGGWFLEAAAMQGIPTAGVSIGWTAPRRELIDPAKEIKAYRDAVRSGQMSLPMVHRELGEDSDEILDEISATNKKLDKLGIVLDSDPRYDNAPAPDSVVPESAQ